MAERIAWFLHPTESSQRVETYKVVKDCYDLRSEVVHGNVKTKPKKYLSWLDAVVQSEELVSAVFLRLLSEQTYIDTMNYSSKLLAQEFKHLVLGENSKLA